MENLHFCGVTEQTNTQILIPVHNVSQMQHLGFRETFEVGLKTGDILDSLRIM